MPVREGLVTAGWSRALSGSLQQRRHEALSRWDHPTRGPIAPARFIPVIALGEPDQYAEQVVSSTIAHALGIPTTAEGVETPEQLDRLAQQGCDVAQGYLFARPSRAREAITHVTADARWTGLGTWSHMAPLATCHLPLTSRGVAWRTA